MIRFALLLLKVQTVLLCLTSCNSFRCIEISVPYDFNDSIYILKSIEERESYLLLETRYDYPNYAPISQYMVLFKMNAEQIKLKKGRKYHIVTTPISYPSDETTKIYYLSPNEKDKVVLKGYWQQLYVVKEIKEIKEAGKKK